MEFCVIAFTSMKLLFPNCPAKPIADVMECKVEAMSAYAKYEAICWDPKTKEIVYRGRVEVEQHT
jgi:hypothetical protein